MVVSALRWGSVLLVLGLVLGAPSAAATAFAVQAVFVGPQGGGGSPDSGEQAACTNPADCWVTCVLGNPTAPLIYFQCTTWVGYPLRDNLNCWLYQPDHVVCKGILSPPEDG